MITWNMAFLVVNILLSMLAANLFCKAPDLLQKAVLGFGMGGCLFLVLYYALEVFTMYDTPWQIRAMGHSAGYTAFVMHVIRLHLIKSGTCRNSYKHSHKPLG